MSDWADGYVTDINYNFGYYHELNPLRQKSSFLACGLRPPVENGVHCELGYGQGLSINIHAAAGASVWYGNDFNPAHAGFAQELAEISGADARLNDESFEEFCTRKDLPEFDSISLHGIWSWVNHENRKLIVDFVKRRLKVGGVLYISYNTQPGWAAMIPMRELLNDHSNLLSAGGTAIVSKIDGALAFADKLMAVNAAYFRVNPSLAERLQKIKEHDRSYLAHEYFNRDWLPMSFSKMAHWLAPAKLSFACSADYMSHVNSVNFTPEQAALLREVPDPILRETVRDFIVNQQFRRDYWIRGARKLDAIERREAYREQKIILTVDPNSVSLKIHSALGEATLQEGVYRPILEMLADYRPKTLAQIEQALAKKGIDFTQIVEAVLVLSSSGKLMAVQDEITINDAKKRTDKLNAWLMKRSRTSGDIAFLASPVTGGGIPVSRFQQVFLLAVRGGQKHPAEWANFARTVLEEQGSKLVKGGKTLETPEENLEELTAQAEEFATKRLPALQALQVI